ncbi:MAG: hypothetical protein JNK67_24925 [Alphaproteobacteria bacterium]|nr:hypothetical protein [Alphaproteobacteria bacterium]
MAAAAARAFAQGLLLRGGFHPGPGDGVPSLPDGGRVATLLMLGNAGPAMWARFAASAESRATPSPLDLWTRRVVAEIADAVGAYPLFPFGGPPYLPFQRWAQRAESVHVSPLKLLIHPEFGLWHAYRGALGFAERLALPPAAPRESPCATCRDRPCLEACPVGAFDDQGYDATRCVNHVRSMVGTACRDDGCQARRACPVGADYRYEPAQARFHMHAFISNPAR